MNITTYAIDIAKSVFQLHWVEPGTGEIHRKKLQRARLMEFFARLQPSRIVMEACGGAHHWGRELAKLGHQVELLPPHKVKESASGNKDDSRDARAIWITAALKDVRRVPVNRFIDGPVPVREEGDVTVVPVYEEVLVVRVHPELLQKQHLPASLVTPRIWKERYEDIRNIEHYLCRNGTVIRKFFFNVSKAEQRRRFLARLSDPAKRWKITEEDIRNAVSGADIVFVTCGLGGGAERGEGHEFRGFLDHVVAALGELFGHLGHAVLRAIERGELTDEHPLTSDVIKRIKSRNASSKFSTFTNAASTPTSAARPSSCPTRGSGGASPRCSQNKPEGRASSL